MKKVLALTLVLAMGLGMFLAFTAVSAAEVGNLTLNKAVYGPGEEIVATVTRGEVYLDIVAIYKHSGESLEWQSAVTLAGESQVVEGSLYAPSEIGNYEAQLFDVDEALVAFAPFTVETSAPTPPYGNEWIQLDKSNYDPEEAMVITVFGVTQDMVDDYACVGIYKKGMPGEWECTLPNVESVGENVIDYVNAPEYPGEYVIALYAKWHQEGELDDLLISSLSFTVGMNAKEGTILLDKAEYAASETILVFYSDITDEMVNSKATVVLCEEGSEHGSGVIDGAIITESSGTLTFTAPEISGGFEARLYTQQYVHNEDTFVMAVPFTVKGEADTSTVTYNGHRYRRIDIGMTWTEAKAYAEDLGGHLATITSQAEQNAVYDLIKDGPMNQYWIGADEPGNWITWEEWTYENWAFGEPDGDGEDERYVQMYRIPNPMTDVGEDAGKWNDINNESYIPGEEEFFSTEFVGLVVEFDNVSSVQISLTVEGTTVTAGIATGRKDKEALIVAVYDSNGKLLAAKYETVLSSVSISPIPAGAYRIKVMLWDGIDTMEPLCGVKSLRKDSSSSSWKLE